MWQEIIFLIGNFVFVAALIPSVLSKNKPAPWTSFMTGFTLLLFTIAFYTLGMHVSAGATLATSILWFVLLIQKIRTK